MRSDLGFDISCRNAVYRGSDARSETEGLPDMQPIKRIQGNIVNRQERRFLDWSCGWMPNSITSDHLTALGVFGAVMVLAGYIAERLDPRFLLLSAAGYVVHWFGDSLDGSLARYRNVTRPRYGYFLDHSVDALCVLMMFGGLGLTSYVRLDVALFVVLGYYALMIHVFLKNHVTNTLQLSFILLGPTELRMIFVAITLWMYVQGPAGLHLAGHVMSDYDIALLVIGTVFLALFGRGTVAMIRQLRAVEGDGRVPQPTAVVEPVRKPVVRHASETQRDRRLPVKERTAY